MLHSLSFSLAFCVQPQTANRSLPGTHERSLRNVKSTMLQGNRKNASNFSAIKSFVSVRTWVKVIWFIRLRGSFIAAPDSTEKSASILLCSSRSTKTYRKSRNFTTITIKLEEKSVEFHVGRRTKRVKLSISILRRPCRQAQLEEHQRVLFGDLRSEGRKKTSSEKNDKNLTWAQIVRFFTTFFWQFACARQREIAWGRRVEPENNLLH